MRWSSAPTRRPIAAAAVVAEAVVAFELARCLREKFGGDHVDDLLVAYRAYLARHPVAPPLGSRRAAGARRRHGRGQVHGRRAVARRLRRGRSSTLDAEIERTRRRGRSRSCSRAQGEPAFRAREAARRDARARPRDAAVVALGGGPLLDPATRDAACAEHALVAWLDSLDRGAGRAVGAAGAGGRSRADRARLRRPWTDRRAALRRRADAILDGGAPRGSLAARRSPSRSGRVGTARSELPAGPPRGSFASSMPRSPTASPGGYRGASSRRRAGASRSAGLERLWRAFAGCRPRARRLACSPCGGTVTDVAGLAAATFRRGIDWIAGPSTLVGQVDAAIGGKTAIDVAAQERRRRVLDAAGRAGRSRAARIAPRRRVGGRLRRVREDRAPDRRPALGARPRAAHGAARARAARELVQRCAGFKTLVVADDPRESGLRAILNLGHTVGHGVEAAAGYGSLRHGEAVAIGLVAALQLSDTAHRPRSGTGGRGLRAARGARPAALRAGSRAGGRARCDAP